MIAKSSTTKKPVWYAVYCRSRQEKKVARLFERDGIEYFLPLIEVVRLWSDRKKKVMEPLFKSYLFVRILPSEYLDVLRTDGVVRFVTFEGKPVPVPEVQIKAIRQYLNKDEIIDDSEFMPEPGDRVEIYRGSLKGLTGEIVSYQGRQKVKIEIESVGKSIFLTIPKSYLQKAG
ncbi:MAG: UpxY family transcription antiterminator [Bacteroidales bacterium]